MTPVAKSDSDNGATATMTSRAAYLKRHLTPPEMDPQTARVIWRDFLFLVAGCIVVSIIGYVEAHASDPEARITVRVTGIAGTKQVPVNPNGIVDTGYILTEPLYQWLKEHRDWNDVLAAINSLILVLPSVYLAYVTIWRGDYSLSFRVIAVQLLRAFCGWFTYLPPDPHYLNSYFDFPDIVHCLFQECAGQIPKQMPFVSFFSGHVATMVVAGNHMWLIRYTRLALLVHVLNAFQIVRLLATRGHYSIDMIIAWYVAVYVSNPAGRLGRYYSKGTHVQEILPKTPMEALEHVTGVTDARNESRMAALLRRKDVQEVLLAMQNEDDEDDDFHSETTARILQEATSQLLQERAKIINEKMLYLQQQGQENLTYLQQQGQEKMTYLQQQGHDGISYLQQQANAVVERHSSGYSSSDSNNSEKDKDI